MSGWFKVYNKFIQNARDLSNSELRLLLLIASYSCESKEEGAIMETREKMTLQKLANNLELCSRTINRNCKKLEEKNYIRIKRDKRKNIKKIYILEKFRMTSVSPSGGHQCHPSMTPVSPSGGHRCHPQPAPYYIINKQDINNTAARHRNAAAVSQRNSEKNEKYLEAITWLENLDGFWKNNLEKIKNLPAEQVVSIYPNIRKKYEEGKIRSLGGIYIAFIEGWKDYEEIKQEEKEKAREKKQISLEEENAFKMLMRKTVIQYIQKNGGKDKLSLYGGKILELGKYHILIQRDDKERKIPYHEIKIPNAFSKLDGSKL